MLGHEYGTIARQRSAAALREGDNARLAREARLHTAQARTATARARSRRIVLGGWWRRIPVGKPTTGLAK